MSNTLWTTLESSIEYTVSEGDPVTIALPLDTGASGLTAVIISGQLASSLELDGFEISGTAPVSKSDVSYTVVIRAESDTTFEDRTIVISVQGESKISWITSSGALEIGENGRQYALYDSLVTYQLEAEDLTGESSLEFFIAPGGGELPPGLEMSNSGFISGVISPDGDPEYTFTVTVTDGLYFSEREFSISIFSQDLFDASNTTVDASSTIFGADVANILPPTWITPSTLNTITSENLLSLKLEAVDYSSSESQIKYTIEALNLDSSVSTLPDGVTLDFDSGALYGNIPYSPAVLQEYKFTARATVFQEGISVIDLSTQVYEDTRSGVSSIKVNKTENLPELVGESIIINGESYTVDSINVQNSVYDIINLSATLVPKYPLVVSQTAQVGDGEIFVNRLSEFNKSQYLEKTLIYGETEEYVISSISPYIEYQITDINQDIISPLPISGGLEGLSLLEHIEQAQTYLEGIYGSPVFIINVEDYKWRIRLPSTPSTRLQSEVLAAFTGGSAIHPFFLEFIRDNEDMLTLDINIQRQFLQGSNIGLAAFTGDRISKNIIIYPEGVTEEDVAYNVRTFTLQVIPPNSSIVEFVTNPSLGSVITDYPLIKNIRAQTTLPGSNIRYDLISGSLPPGISLSSQGELSGIVDFNDGPFDNLYEFTVTASDYSGSNATQSFSLSVNAEANTKYINIEARPFMDGDDEQRYTDFLSDPLIFDPAIIYRQNDRSYGIAKSMPVMIMSGVPIVSTQDLLGVVEGAQKMSLYFGEVKSAVARDPESGLDIYEVVYVEMVDKNLSTSDLPTQEFYDDGSGGSKLITNITNLQNRISELGDINYDYLPRWMKTPQDDGSLGFKLAMPICYTIPGESSRVVEKIANSGFDFKTLNYQVDRFVVEDTSDNSTPQFIIFHD